MRTLIADSSRLLVFESPKRHMQSGSEWVEKEGPALPRDDHGPRNGCVPRRWAGTCAHPHSRRYNYASFLRFPALFPPERPSFPPGLLD